MGSGVWALVFVVGVAVSLGSSWVLVGRLERLGARLGLSEALLGMVAALAADAPEITSAVTALGHGQARVGAGVVIGSNVFNLAALLGLGALVAGRIALHRRVVWLSGAVAVWVAVGCLLAVLGVLTPLWSLVAVLAVLVPYVVLLGLRPARLTALALPAAWSRWLTAAIHEEESELEEAIAPRPGTWLDAAVGAAALLVVVAASTVMERGASVLGTRWHVSDIVVGALVLAVVTSLPNAVAAVYLAAHGRGAAVLSTALNSNALNVAFGLLVPAAVTGLSTGDGQDVLVASWYGGLTLAAVLFAFKDRGLTRVPGVLIIVGYLAFTATLLAAVAHGAIGMMLAVLPAVAVASVCALVLVRPTTSRGAASVPASTPARASASLVAGWSAHRMWALSFLLCAVVAAFDAATGRRVVLIGLLAIGPCCALLTARWRHATATGLLALGLGVALGVPDGVFGTAVQYAFLAAIALVTVFCVAAAGVIERYRYQT